MWTAFIVGIVTQASLVISIGPQNMFVLRQGLAGEYVALTVWFCVISDIILAFMAIYGLSYMADLHKNVMLGFQICGILFLFTYAAIALNREIRG